MHLSELAIKKARAKDKKQKLFDGGGLYHDLQQLIGQGRYLFPGARSNMRPMSDATLINALRRMGYSSEEMTAHGFRSMASTLLNEQGYNRDWIERQLAHAERNNVRAAYNYSEYLPDRRRMMQEWADYLGYLAVRDDAGQTS